MDTKVADALIGALIDGRYRVRGRVARGGMATVYTATDERLERIVALKIIHPGQARDQHFLDRFTDEAKTIARLTHPNVVAVYDQGVHEGLPYLIMEYVRGRTLRELLIDRHRLVPAEALAVLEQILAAVGAAHRAGLVHRDIKPENVLVAESPGSTSLVDAVVKVADFGLARAVEASAEESGGQLIATVAYVAPELVTDGHADPRTDVYSAGIVLFEMLTGRVPFEGDRPVEVAWQHVDNDVPAPSRLVPGLPAAVDALVTSATCRQPTGRPGDAGALLAQVQEVRDELATVTPAPLAAGTMPVPRVEQTQAFIHPPTQAPPMEAAPASGPPTMVIPASFGPPVDEGERPSWARLPSGPPGGGGGGRRRTDRPAREGGLPALYRRITSTSGGRTSMIVALILVGVLVLVGGWWFGIGRYTSAPSLVGLSKDQAVAAAHDRGLSVHFDDGRYDEKIPKGTVVGQQPGGDQRIVRGGTLTLTLSLGPERYPVPDESGKAYDEAAKDLNSKRLVPKRVDAYDDTMPVGHVLSTDPVAGTIVPPGTEITVKVSKGKAPITVPNVIGQDADTAQQKLKSLGLQVAFKQQQSDKPANTVIDQSVPDGSGVEKNTLIVLTISSGPPMVTVPDVSNQGLTFDQANQILQQSNLVGVKGGFDLPGAQVRSQNPAAGTQVPPGTQVQLWLSP